MQSETFQSWFESSGQFVPESFDEMCSRYSGFGCGLWDHLKQTLPEVFERLSFYRDTEYQTEDVYAVCTWSKKPFVIQLDPDIELIVLYDRTTQTEIGTWDPNPMHAAEEFIRQTFG